MSYLGRSSVIWHCCKCDSINVDSFTFNSFELFTSNIFTPLTDLDTTFESVASSSFSPLHTSSPQTAWTNPRRRLRQTSTDSSISSSRATDRSSKTQAEFPMKSTNLRLLTVNCCGIRTNKAEFAAALDYTKPDLVCGTESWLRGIKVSKVAKIRNRYNQVPHLTQDTNGKVTNSQKTPQTKAKRTALSQQVTTKHI